MDISKMLKSKSIKCYDLKTSLNSNYVNLSLNYVNYREIDHIDKITAYIIDGDILCSNSTVLYEGSEGQDLGAKDVMYEIR